MRVGVTTSADLFSELDDDGATKLLEITEHKDFELRIVPALNVMAAKPEELADQALNLMSRSSDRLRLGAVKLMTDGSIQGFTGRLKWPGYINGRENGIWNTPPQQLNHIVEIMHANGLQLTILEEPFLQHLVHKKNL